MADEEFGDEIDWSTVDLPSISSSMMVAHPRSSNTNPGASAATFDGYHHSGTNTSSRNNNLNNGGNDNHSNNNFHPSAGGWGASSPAGTGMVGVVRGGSMVSPSNHLSSENEDALRRQVRDDRSRVIYCRAFEHENLARIAISLM